MYMFMYMTMSIFIFMYSTCTSTISYVQIPEFLSEFRSVISAEFCTRNSVEFSGSKNYR
jgi:hypothetical protein